jgi:hypothetical protein
MHLSIGSRHPKRHRDALFSITMSAGSAQNGTALAQPRYVAIVRLAYK